MKKSEKIKAARKLLNEARRIGLKLELVGNFVQITPADKVPMEMTMALVRCADEFRELAAETNIV